MCNGWRNGLRLQYNLALRCRWCALQTVNMNSIIYRYSVMDYIGRLNLQGLSGVLCRYILRLYAQWLTEGYLRRWCFPVIANCSGVSVRCGSERMAVMVQYGFSIF